MDRYNRSLTFVYRAYTVTLALLILCCVALPPTRTIHLINGWNSPILDSIFSTITHFGNGIILVPFVILLLFRNIYMSLALIVSGALQGMVVLLFKDVLFPFSERPIRFLNVDLIHKVPGVVIHNLSSFPSGHSVTAFGFCVFISLCYRNNFLSSLLLVLAIAVGISRVYLLQHFLWDVSAGAMIGTLMAVLTYHYFDRIKKPEWMLKHIRISFRLSDKKANSIGQ